MAEMKPPQSGEITGILRKLAQGEAAAANELMPYVYHELRSIASSYLRKERPDHTLQPTALVHEAYLRLVGIGSVDFASRAHFFGLAASMMRHILIDHARRRLAHKRGPGGIKIELDDRIAFTENKCVFLLE